jgi:signal transduction histidine kinase
MAFDITRVETLEAFAEALAQQPPTDIVLADYRLPGFTARDAWARAEAVRGRVPFVLLSGAIGEAAAVEVMRDGFSDFLLKDDMARLGHVVQRSLELRDARLAREQAAAELARSERQLAELTEHLQTSIEQERAAIAREVHDDIGGALAAVRFDLAWIGRHAEGEAMQGHVQAATEMLQHAIGASQRILQNLRPPILDQGLLAAIQWLAESFQKRTGTATTVTALGDCSALPQAVQLVAYRTTQEALTNVSKYAACSAVGVALECSDGMLTLEVSDNGPGIEPAALQKPKSFGLKGLAERARTVDGWLDVARRPAGGTSVILSVPLAPISEPEEADA